MYLYVQMELNVWDMISRGHYLYYDWSLLLRQICPRCITLWLKQGIKGQ